MTSNQKYLSDVFVGAFNSTPEAKELAEKIVVDRIRLFKEAGRAEVWILPEPKLTDDENMLLTACIEVYLFGELTVELKLAEDRSRICWRLKTMSDADKRNAC